MLELVASTIHVLYLVCIFFFLVCDFCGKADSNARVCLCSVPRSTLSLFRLLPGRRWLFYVVFDVIYAQGSSQEEVEGIHEIVRDAVKSSRTQCAPGTDLTRADLTVRTMVRTEGAGGVLMTQHAVVRSWTKVTSLANDNAGTEQ